jgi:hypothetical protein
MEGRDVGAGGGTDGGRGFQDGHQGILR